MSQPIDEDAERKVAWRLAIGLLILLTVVKPLGGIAYVGAIAFTFAAAVQLYVPLWRSDKLKRDTTWVGLHLGTWKKDLKLVGVLILLTWPAYILGYHLYMTSLHGWLEGVAPAGALAYVPQATFGPNLPDSPQAWAKGALWFLEIAATHALGVALPEEAFYRGYLQPRLQSRWAPKWRIAGVPIGWAALVTCGLFALGHFLGEWNPLRLGPFFPALIFAWQRNATGSVVGAITFHAGCNILGEVLFALYQL